MLYLCQLSESRGPRVACFTTVIHSLEHGPYDNHYDEKRLFLSEMVELDGWGSVLTKGVLYDLRSKDLIASNAIILAEFLSILSEKNLLPTKDGSDTVGDYIDALALSSQRHLCPSHSMSHLVPPQLQGDHLSYAFIFQVFKSIRSVILHYWLALHGLTLSAE